MKEIVADKNLVAYCGLYCGACKAYLKDKCPGCQNNEKAKWCKVKICCIENKWLSCADCKKFVNVLDCKLYNNFFYKFFKIVFRSDRTACINLIKEKGYDNFVSEMFAKKAMTIKR